MRKRVSEIVAAALLCACLALAGTMALAVAGLLNDGPTAQAQDAGGGDGQQGGDAGADGEGEAEPELTEWQKARIAEYQDARDAAAGVSGQAAQGMISGLASQMNEGTSDAFTVSATGLNPDYWHQFIFQVRSLRSDGETHSRGGIGFDNRCDGVIVSAEAPRRATTFSKTLTLYACDEGTYQVESQLRLVDHNDDPVEVTTLDTDVATVTVKCVGSLCVPTLPTPPAPSNFRVTSTGETSARVAWSAQSNISRFQISGGPRDIHPTRSSTSVPVIGLTCGTRYTFRIRADGDNTNTKGWSNWSSSASTTTTACPPTITISRNRSFVTEGQDAEFTLRASPAPASSITVKVSVSERGSFIKGTKPTSVTISANQRTATLAVETKDDSADENHGSITARVIDGTGYTVGSPSLATMTVRDNDPTPTVAPTPTPVPVDKAPSFGTPVSNKTWKQNTRIPSFTLPRATGGDGTLRYSLSPALPAGVSRSGRSVSGTPTGTMARTKYTWKVTDSDRTDPDSATLSFYITVNADLAPTFGTATTISDKSWTHNKAITSFSLPQATGGDGALTYSLSRGQTTGSRALPAGVSRSGRSVSGTPSALLANTEFTWTATDSDGDKASLMFDIEVLPQVSIARKKAEVAEGQNAEFTLTASAAPAASLAVTVRVTQSGTFISGTAPTSATISASRTTATLSVPTAKDSIDEADGSVSAEVRTGTGYAVGSAASASVSVRDTPRISIAAGTSPVTEGANATFTITAAGAPLSSISIPVSVTQSGAFIKGTAPTSVTIAANGTSATVTVATENDEVDEPDGSITATLSGGAASPYVVVSGSASASVTVNDNDVKLATPANFTVTPLPQRKARLSWGAVPNALAGYQVEVTSGSSSKVFSARQPSYEIALDSILNGKGLAHADAYQFKVRSIYDLGGPPMNTGDDDTSDPYVDSGYSSIMQLVDNPILDGGSALGSTGTVRLQWNAVSGASGYTVQYRRLGSSFFDHTHEEWLWSAEWPYYGSTATRTVRQADSTVVSQDITGLQNKSIYAFQINYTTAAGTKVYSARDAYAWVSSDFPRRGSRVATYPFFGHWPGRFFSYTICRNTFPSDTKQGWVNLINKAFTAWELGIIRTQYAISDTCASSNPMEFAVAHLNDVNEIIMAAAPPADPDAFKHEVRQTIGIDNIGQIILQIIRFNHEIDTEALPMCLFFNDNTPACVISPVYTGNPQASIKLTGSRRTVDMLIRGNRPMETDVPSDIRFNTCEGSQYENYELILHEAGHALGISGFNISRLLSEYGLYAMAHPRIPDSVMNYDWRIPIFNVNEPDCAPHPFDIMAIYALYQGVN